MSFQHAVGSSGASSHLCFFFEGSNQVIAARVLPCFTIQKVKLKEYSNHFKPMLSLPQVLGSRSFATQKLRPPTLSLLLPGAVSSFCSDTRRCSVSGARFQWKPLRFLAVRLDPNQWKGFGSGPNPCRGWGPAPRFQSKMVGWRSPEEQRFAMRCPANLSIVPFRSIEINYDTSLSLLSNEDLLVPNSYLGTPAFLQLRLPLTGDLFPSDLVQPPQQPIFHTEVQH